MNGSQSRAILAVVCLMLAVSASGCSRGAAYEHPAAKVVQRLLETRQSRSTDASDYAPFFADGALAVQVAAGTAQQSGSGKSPLPGWYRPYVATVTADAADVVVRWRRSEGFSEWPPATRFSVERLESRWVVIDAVSLGVGKLPSPGR